MADIFIGSHDNKNVYQFSWLPSTFPEFNRTSKNEVFESYSNGDFNIIGAMNLLEFGLEGKLPITPSKYSFSKSNIGAYKIINLMHSSMSKKKPVRLIINRNPNPTIPTNLINILVSVESMTWKEENDIVNYNVSFKEYRNV